jgi:hypothetical protein
LPIAFYNLLVDGFNVIFIVLYSLGFLQRQFSRQLPDLLLELFVCMSLTIEFVTVGLCADEQLLCIDSEHLPLLDCQRPLKYLAASLTELYAGLVLDEVRNLHVVLREAHRLYANHIAVGLYVTRSRRYLVVQPLVVRCPVFAVDKGMVLALSAVVPDVAVLVRRLVFGEQCPER